ncbi:hypothetical protein GCM10007868_17090 [Gluconobacter frateurii]|uniref:Uncharacterized protein n=1 Tax=Gluconobacter frateurii NRIC 0228 TaxID=1307946 RepID=A0ABQ0QF50_9PROT|nr:hypothetical protein AA0228_2836 [Gluconobacter frateurii NRIC 0228]GLP90634.1 hypothetical protein GCM10007868_17090 [Gluconobacter frateurii]
MTAVSRIEIALLQRTICLNDSVIAGLHMITFIRADFMGVSDGDAVYEHPNWYETPIEIQAMLRRDQKVPMRHTSLQSVLTDADWHTGILPR